MWSLKAKEFVSIRNATAHVFSVVKALRCGIQGCLSSDIPFMFFKGMFHPEINHL